MKTVYIAHPLRGDIEVNLKRVHGICQRLHTAGEIVPLSPLHAFNFVDPRGPQEQVLNYCRVLLSKADELWVYGDWRESEGCQMEIQFAREHRIPIKFMSVAGCDWCGHKKIDCSEYLGHTVCEGCQEQHHKVSDKVEKASKYVLLNKMEALP